MPNITTDWEAIQVRTLDPYESVESDITSRLTKILGSDKAYVTGFDLIDYECDRATNSIYVSLTAGIGVISNIVIEIKEPVTIKLASFDNLKIPTSYTVALEYQYEKITPVPIAKLVSIAKTSIDTIHLPLFTFRFQNYSTFVETEVLKEWFSQSEDYIADERMKSGYITRIGGTIYGPLKQKILDELGNLLPANTEVDIDKVENNEFVTKAYVDKLINELFGNIIGSDNVDGLLGNYVKRSGSNITGPLHYVNNPSAPECDDQLVAKIYVDQTFIKHRGDTMTGPLILWRRPILPMEAATRDYADWLYEKLKQETSEMIGNHSVLINLDADDHPQYLLTDGSRVVTGPLEYIAGTRIDQNQTLVTKIYVDDKLRPLQEKVERFLELKIDSIKSHSLLEDLGAPHDDHKQYMPINASRGFTQPVSGQTPTEPSHLTTKEFVEETIDSKIEQSIGSGLAKTLSHTNLRDKDRDDHPQYILADGSRAFTGNIIVPDPIEDSHAATKGWVIEEVFNRTNEFRLGNGINYILSDGSVPFTSQISCEYDAIDNNNLVRLRQIKEMLTKIDHRDILNRDDIESHPQYLLKAGGTMTGALTITLPTEDLHPITYGMHKEVLTTISDMQSQHTALNTYTNDSINHLNKISTWIIE